MAGPYLGGLFQTLDREGVATCLGIYALMGKLSFGKHFACIRGPKRRAPMT